eukprot:TRINITY_DN24627_c0_g1_i1.p1 TRINITY_DN24627_c0_g1~~TRINITY_DN24627_c0_g1_i1.p1  ORF type:complete len:317 (+),score=46.43 TRINITY_DN24627_c0_g1_i1:64-1014(+)
MCIRDRVSTQSTWDENKQNSMQKLYGFERGYDINRIRRARSKVRVSSGRASRMLDDLLDVISPLVASTRLQCGLVESTESFNFRRFAQPFVQDEEVTLDKAEAHQIHMTDLSSLLQQRALPGCVDLEPPVVKISQKLADLLEIFPIPEHLVLPRKRFETRRDWAQITQLVKKNAEESIRKCHFSALDFKNVSWIGLPDEWPLNVLKFDKKNLQNDASNDIPAEIAKTNVVRTRVKVEVQWGMYNGEDIDARLTKFVRNLVIIKSLSELHLSLYRSELGDEGCRAVSYLLRHCRAISRLIIWMQEYISVALVDVDAL